ncbi:hypothetical protein Q3G72_018340 [Acer saccharum]|nr:hypothetical protein Q3G72_018340 [Acer saccharum]
MCSVENIKSDKISYSDVVWWSRNYGNEYKAHTKVKEATIKRGICVKPRWEAPASGVYKINCSALVDVGKNKVSIGILIRNDSGSVMASCSQIVDATFDANVAGIMAIYRGMLFSKDCGLEPCVVESDKDVAVYRVCNDNFQNASFGTILAEINELRSSAIGLDIRAIPFQANRVAQSLAKNALVIMENNFWMEDFPECIRGLVEADMPI